MIRVIVSIVVLAGCARTLTPEEQRDRQLRAERYSERGPDSEQQRQREAALHAYCLEHPLECERFAAEQRQRDQARRDATMRALFGPDNKPYPTETRTQCQAYGNSAECTTTRR